MMDSLKVEDYGVELKTIDYAKQPKRVKELAKRYKFSFVPTLIIVNEEGSELNKWSGIRVFKI